MSSTATSATSSQYPITTGVLNPTAAHKLIVVIFVTAAVGLFILFSGAAYFYLVTRRLRLQARLSASVEGNLHDFRRGAADRERRRRRRRAADDLTSLDSYENPPTGVAKWFDWLALHTPILPRISALDLVRLLTDLKMPSFKWPAAAGLFKKNRSSAPAPAAAVVAAAPDNAAVTAATAATSRPRASSFISVTTAQLSRPWSKIRPNTATTVGSAATVVGEWEEIELEERRPE